jgi:predicted permease
LNDRPPAFARLVLRYFAPSERVEDIDGDLLELFHLRIGESGLRHARFRYWLDVLSVLARSRRLRRGRHVPTSHQQQGSMTSTMSAAASELRYAARGLAKRPGYAGVAAFTLALGIGSTVAIFTVLNAVLLRPLPYPAADQIVEIVHHAPGLNMPEVRSSSGLTARYRQSARTFSHVGGYVARQFNLSGGGAAERVRAIAVSPAVFDVLATRPALGRAFNDADTDPNGPFVTILTDSIWRSRFGGDPAVVGRTVRLDGRSAEIVGVMPAGFAFPDVDTRLFVPWRLDPEHFGAFGNVAIARLAPGATLEAARREIEQLQPRIPEWFPGITDDVLARFGWSSSVSPLRARVVANVATTLWILFATVGLVLLVAAANVANLFLVRAESRQREVAVKAALGASRGRIAVTFLAESVVLAVIGGVIGLLLADAGTRLLLAYGPPGLPRLQEVRLDTTAFAFTAALSLLAAAVLAVLATLGVARRSFNTLLREGGRGNTAARARHRVRNLLIVTQVAMALVLLVGAGLMLRSVMRLTAVDPGFRVDGLLSATLSLGARGDRAQSVAIYHRLLDEMATVPGVSAAGAAGTLPVAATSLTGSNFEVRSRVRSDSDPPLFTMYTAVTAGYFETLAAPLVEGRAPARSDADRALDVAWVNRAFARQFLDGRAIGERIRIAEGAWLEVVGVVGDLRTSGLGDDVRPMVYLPTSNSAVSLDVMYAVVRTRGDPASLGPALRTAVDRVDATVPLTMRTMEDIVSASLAQKTFTLTLLAIAAAIGLVLGVVGLYGAVSYIASQRTAEIGVRLALGAKPASVCFMVLRQGTTVAAVGIVVGLVAAWSAARFMSSMLFEVSAHDPITYASVALVLAAVSVFATYVPARRAAGVDPVRALRNDG